MWLQSKKFNKMRYGYKRKVINQTPTILAICALAVLIKGIDAIINGKYPFLYISLMFLVACLIGYAINLYRKLP
jgi:amino acid permease